MVLRRMVRGLWLSSMLALAALGSPGCAVSEAENVASADDEITEVEQSDVKRQSIGNCWIYATTSWLEALNKGATGTELNTSESWLTYWHWFGQLSRTRPPTEIATGGSYRTAAQLIERYGLMNERDFVPAEANAEMSNRQKTALTKINAALKSGRLTTLAAKGDRAGIRTELDLAWGLDAAQRARIDAVFGAAVDRTLDKSEVASKAATANKVILPRDVQARLIDPKTKKSFVGTLADAIGTSGVNRMGPFAFNDVTYPSNPTQRRALWKRVQRALHDQVPVLMSWKVDFNALSRESRFSLAELARRGAGKQGGHMTLMHDYQANVPGVGLLEAGKQATPDQMTKALADATVIEFVRVKNSWGGIRPDRWDDAVIPGYHDLDLTYLNGPIKECEVDAKGETDTKNCKRDHTPLWDVVLPAGY